MVKCFAPNADNDNAAQTQQCIFSGVDEVIKSCIALYWNELDYFRREWCSRKMVIGVRSSKSSRRRILWWDWSTSSHVLYYNEVDIFKFKTPLTSPIESEINSSVKIKNRNLISWASDQMPKSIRYAVVQNIITDYTAWNEQ